MIILYYTMNAMLEIRKFVWLPRFNKNKNKNADLFVQIVVVVAIF